jgi:hypothetical protein
VGCLSGLQFVRPLAVYLANRFSIPPQDLKDLMRRAGDVTFADAHKDRKNEG